MFDSNFYIAASAAIVFIGFYCTYKNSDCVKTANTAYYNKYRSGDNSKDFFENPYKHAEADKQKTDNKQDFRVAF